MHKHTNHLIHETSPYLLQHAHNPVNWYPWGEEALQKAKHENKPILVSIGYAACHWCHVMEKESFEDETTASIMNEYFINIKIDREERPDLDHIYMDAVQAITGSGGWPLNVFLTPDAKPFYGGTYFPPVQAFNRPSWTQVLENIHDSYINKYDQIIAQADNLTAHIQNANSFGINAKAAESFQAEQKEQLATIVDNLLKNADTEWGGFGKAPKFPQTFSINYLLRHYHFTKHEQSLQQAILTLDKMIDGGIYDQIGGGFARYSTDNTWLAPHFEKMLYDNALLLQTLSEAYQLTNNNRYKQIIEQTIGFLQRELKDTSGGYYSALDADSEGEEGKYYVWSKAEIENILKGDAPIFCVFYNVTEEGNWEHHNILRVVEPLEKFASKYSITPQELETLLQSCAKKLLTYREQRVKPALDDKILLGWNALLVTAFAKCYAATQNQIYLEEAVTLANFLISSFCQDQTNAYWHTYKKGVAKIDAFLEDYAYLIQALIQVNQITQDVTYLQKAKNITEYVITHFSDTDACFFFFTHQHQTDIVVRKKEIYDGAIPSGNATMAQNLQYLSILFHNSEWKQRAEKMILSVSTAALRYPTSFGNWAALLQQMLHGTEELVIAGNNANEYIRDVLNCYLPYKLLVCTSVEDATMPITFNKIVKNSTFFYRCKNYACHEPKSTIDEFLTDLC